MATENVMRASDSDREQVVETLRGQYAEGRLTLEEFDERTSAAYGAKTWTDLRQLTRDLPVKLSFDPNSPAVTPGPAAPAQWGPRWPGPRLLVLIPVAFVWIMLASADGWAHSRGHHVFFPVIPLTIMTLFAFRWLIARQGRRPTR